VIYYRVEFTAAPETTVRAKRFRTTESARKHAMRVLGLADQSGLESKVSIVAVRKNGTSDEQPRHRGTA
jgi:hypothetical protein